MSVVDKLRSFAESREAPDVVCCGLTYRDIREAHATIADLRDRLRVMAPMACMGCACTVEQPNDYDEVTGYCEDCDAAAGFLLDDPADAAACLSVGLRALCGRRLLEGCE